MKNATMDSGTWARVTAVKNVGVIQKRLFLPYVTR